MPSTHTADFQTGALKAIDLEAVEKVNVGLETELVKKHVNIIADAPEIRIQDKTGSAPEVNATTMSIVADGGTTHFRAGTETFAEGTETKGNIKFQSSTGATTHAEIVGSSGKLELQDGGLGLKLGSNVSVSGTSKVIQEITGPHARESAALKKYPEVPLSSNVQSGYVIEASSEHSSGTYPGWNAFNGVVETTNGADGEWISGAGKYNTSATNGAYLAHSSNAVLFQGARGEYLGIVLPHRIKVKYVSVYGRPDSGSPRTVREYRLWGSNDGSTWNQLQTGTNTLAVPASTNKFNITVDATTAYSRYRLQALSMNTGEGGVSIGELEYYGYEEVGAGDDSVDTTVKSVYNAPNLTSAALYIDAAKTGTSVTDQSGSTPSVTVTATGVTYDSTEKAWELTGAATSNIVTADLGFEGDQPHSVSAWVKADQLNGDGLFHVGTAEGEGDAASRVGFVDDSHISWGGEDHYFSNAEWHNVTYTYNGEGSDKKLYLDGRLVGTAKNEDTFGDYPPFAMTNYSQYGYTVSASAEHGSGNYSPWELFDGNITSSSDSYETNGGRYDTSSSPYEHTSGVSTTVSGTSYTGDWVQVSFPFKFKVDQIDLMPQVTYGLERMPQTAIVAGSNDNTNWTLIKSITTDAHALSEYTNYKVSATRAYRYIRFIWNTLTTAGSNASFRGRIAGQAMRFFGHRENDLVRFPDSVNTLTYPHVAMTGPAQRGYVVTASTNHSGTSFSGKKTTYQGKPFDQDGTTFWHTETNGTNDYRYDGTDYAYGPGSLSNFDPSGINIKGEWIKLQFPTKKKISRVYIRARSGAESQAPEDFSFYGSNTDADGEWTLIQAFTGQSPQDDGTSYYDITSNPAHYKYILLLVTKAVSTTAMSISTLEYIGTEENLDVIARVGDGFDGKVRNVRVYSTALSDARVQEIFDADKDELGLAKSSVSVYRGHLGVGTTEPKAALTVMDEVAELEEFPPRGISVVGVSAATLGVQQHIEGHGVFRMSTSSNHGSAGSVPGAFDKQTNTYWHAAGAAYSGTDYSYPTTGTSSLAGIRGDWLRLELPYKVKLSSIGIRARSGFGTGYTYDQSPEDFTILGNNDNGIWTVIQSFTGKSWSDIRSTTIPITTGPGAYNSFAIVITRVANSTGLTIAELRYFGTREQGASTLHNGELSLTRNLTVPRIGPPLDADDTPRRDRLVVEYNTSTNNTENGVVKDTSGRGLDGRLISGAYYDASEKVLAFDGANDYIATSSRAHFTESSGAHSFSAWMNFHSAGQWEAVYSFGTNSGNVTNFTVYVGNNVFRVESRGVTTSNGGVVYRDYTYTFTNNNWVHMAVTWDGTGGVDNVNIYMDKVKLSQGSAVSNGTSSIALPSSYPIYLGADVTTPAAFLHGSMSNPKIWDVVLTTDEVRRLYDMGRHGKVFAKPLYITAPLHAPGTVVQVVTKPIEGQASYTSSSGADVNLAVLQTSITPKFSNSKMVVQVYMSYEADYNAVLFVRANDADIPSGRTYGLKEGTIPVAYDGDRGSTPNSSAFVVHHNVSSTQPVTYKVFYKANQSGTIKLNEGYSTTDEHGMCYVVIWEIAQ